MVQYICFSRSNRKFRCSYAGSSKVNTCMIQEKLLENETGYWFKLSRPFIIIMIAVVAVMIYQNEVRKSINRYGVYTKCVITDVSGHKGGIFVRYSFSIHNKKHEGQTSSSEIGKRAINKQYMIKVLPSDPSSAVILSPVSDCLLDSIPPPEGWTELPKCQ